MNQGFTYSERIDRRGEGRAVAVYMASRYGHSTETQWRERLSHGLVLLDGAPADAGAVLKTGQTLTWSRPAWEEPEVPLTYAVLHEDADILAIAKPAGLPTMPAGGFLENTLFTLVRRAHPEASPVHRLGRGTSGIVLFAKSARAGETLARAWRERRVTKIYRALVQGRPAQDAFRIETPIGPVSHAALGTVHAANPLGKASRSDVRVLERQEENSLVEVQIATGRPHQIRIHMAACGHPLVGDPLYAPGGGIRPETAALPGDTGYLLHATRLSFPHPATGEPMGLDCPPPSALKTASE